jgi:hypothetical protein
MTESVLRHPFLFASQGAEPKGVRFNTCVTHVKSRDETTSVISSQLEKPSNAPKLRQQIAQALGCRPNGRRKRLQI